MSQESDKSSFGDPVAMWKQWQETWGTYYESSAKMWSNMLDESMQAAARGQFVPPDPLTFLRQWYDVASQSWSKESGDSMSREQFMKAASGFLEHYARFIIMLRQTNDEYLKNFQLPTRSDLSGLAELIVALEEKVDQVDDSMESLQAQTAQLATGESLHRLEARFGALEQKLAALRVSIESSQQGSETGMLHERLERVESKVDQLLTAFEKLASPASSKERELPAVHEVPKAPRRRAPKGEQRDFSRAAHQLKAKTFSKSSKWAWKSCWKGQRSRRARRQKR